MPAVPVRATSNIVVRDTNGKLVLVELQGKIECNSGDLSGRTIGELSLEQTPTLVTGSQRLAGRRVPLKKPIAVLETPPCAYGGGEQTVEVIQVITEKYLFDTRPTTILPPPGSQ